jgi:hypothetical protein
MKPRATLRALGAGILCLAAACGTAPETAPETAPPAAEGGAPPAAAVPAGDAPVADTPRTPPPGSAARRGVLDGLRAEMDRLHGRTLRFTVRHLAAADGWAWVEADPEDDAGGRYEGVAALLRERPDGWEVVEFMPGFGEREGTPHEDACRWFDDLLRRHPRVQPAILPAGDRPPCGG